MTETERSSKVLPVRRAAPLRGRVLSAKGWHFDVLAVDERAHAALRLLLLLGWLAFIFFWSSRSQLPRLGDMEPELVAVAGHFTAYSVLTMLLWAVLPSARWSIWRRFGVALIGAVAYGMSDEWHQSFVAGRDPALFDLIIDTLAAVSALIAVGVVMHMRKSRSAQ